MTPPGVTVLGYLREAKGIGEGARGYARALAAAGVPVRTGAIEAQNTPHVAGEEHPAAQELRRSTEHPVSLLCMNAPELAAHESAGPRLPPSRWRIGLWVWEADPAPAEWAEISELLDEIWVPSRYVAELIGRVARVPVVVVPHSIAMEPALERPVESPFTFLFSFDLHSTLRRKNPEGLIAAYRDAFPDPGGATRLMLKTINGDHRPGALEGLREAAGGRPDIELRDGYVPDDERRRLLEECSCYVSLHRSEGFGLTLAEAMALGRPVVATGYSGNLDFMPPGTAYPVRAEAAPVGPGVGVYPPEAMWAEPDLEHAAAQMRAVHADPAEAARRAERGRMLLRERFSPEAVGAIARRRLELTGAGRRRFF